MKTSFVAHAVVESWLDAGKCLLTPAIFTKGTACTQRVQDRQDHKLARFSKESIMESGETILESGQGLRLREQDGMLMPEFFNESLDPSRWPVQTDGCRSPIEASGQTTSPIQAIHSITSAEELVEYMEMHRGRVRSLLQVLPEIAPDLFRGIDHERLMEFATVHDEAKVRTDDAFLEEWDLQQPMAHFLAQNWGQNLRAPGMEEVFELVVDHLNFIDHQIEDRKLEELGIPQSQWGQYKLVVDVADRTDRAMHPMTIEELNKVITPTSASPDFLPDAGGVVSQDRLREILTATEGAYSKLFPQDLIEEFFQRRDSLAGPPRSWERH